MYHCDLCGMALEKGDIHDCKMRCQLRGLTATFRMVAPFEDGEGRPIYNFVQIPDYVTSLENENARLRILLEEVITDATTEYGQIAGTMFYTGPYGGIFCECVFCGARHEIYSKEGFAHKPNCLILRIHRALHASEWQDE